MSFEITGTIHEISDTNQVSDRFKKREFVVEKKENNGGAVFQDYIKFQLTQDRVSLVDNFKVGDEVKIMFNIRGNRWEKAGKVNYFTNLDAWRIEGNESSGPSEGLAGESFSDDSFQEESFGTMETGEGDDLPF
jgi:hypothetical protein